MDKAVGLDLVAGAVPALEGGCRRGGVAVGVGGAGRGEGGAAGQQSDDEQGASGQGASGVAKAGECGLGLFLSSSSVSLRVY